MVKLRSLMSVLLLAGAGTAVFASPLFACHEPTGWCCTHIGCCYFENDEIVDGTCFLLPN